MDWIGAYPTVSTILKDAWWSHYSAIGSLGYFENSWWGAYPCGFFSPTPLSFFLLLISKTDMGEKQRLLLAMSSLLPFCNLPGNDFQPGAPMRVLSPLRMTNTTVAPTAIPVLLTEKRKNHHQKTRSLKDVFPWKRVELHTFRHCACAFAHIHVSMAIPPHYCEVALIPRHKGGNADRYSKHLQASESLRARHDQHRTSS